MIGASVNAIHAINMLATSIVLIVTVWCIAAFIADVSRKWFHDRQEQRAIDRDLLAFARKRSSRIRKRR